VSSVSLLLHLGEGGFKSGEGLVNVVLLVDGGKAKAFPYIPFRYVVSIGSVPPPRNTWKAEAFLSIWRRRASEQAFAL
jgi:hypothetical protein